MTILVRTSVKTYFTTGSRPTQSQFGDFIDSALFLAETTSQTIVGSIIVSGTTYAAGGFQSTTGSFSGLVSAGSLNVQGAVSAASLNATGDINAATGRISSSAASFVNAVSAGSLHIDGIVSADAVHCSAARINDGVKFSIIVVSAAGTTQGTAAPVSGAISNFQGVTDGVTTGFILTQNAGRVSYIANNTAVSANLYPPSGGTINALGANAAFALAARTAYTIFPLGPTTFFVK